MRPAQTEVETNVPAFLSKLWKIVNDPDTDHLISWSPGGDSFVIQNQAQFWYNLLPIYYKHNNMSSFIRQLNMYGFHKMSSDNGSIESDKDEIRFFHPLFIQDKPHLMKFIKRKIASNKSASATGDDKVNNVDQITRVLVDVKQLRGRQESVDNQLAAMKQENAALWRELALLRQKHLKQQQIVNKLIHFLVTIVQPTRNSMSNLGVKRRLPLMIHDGREKVSKTDAFDGPTIHELDAEHALTDSLLLDETEPTEESNIHKDNTEVSANSPSSEDNLTESSAVLLNLPIIDDSENSSDNANLLLGEEEVATAIANDNDEVTNLFEQTELNQPSQETFPNNQKVQEVVIEVPETEEYMDLNMLKVNSEEEAKNKMLLNPDMQDALISNLVADNKQPENENTENQECDKSNANNLTVATRSNPKDANFKVNSADDVFRDDLDSHLESTQDELELIKEMLFDGYSLDANALLGNEVNYRYDAVPLQLFNPDESFPLDVPQLVPEETNKSSTNLDNDPMLSGSEVAPYNTPFSLDFENLFEENNTSDTVEDNAENANESSAQTEVNTPVFVKAEPKF